MSKWSMSLSRRLMALSSLLRMLESYGFACSRSRGDSPQRVMHSIVLSLRRWSIGYDYLGSRENLGLWARVSFRRLTPSPPRYLGMFVLAWSKGRLVRLEMRVWHGFSAEGTMGWSFRYKLDLLQSSLLAPRRWFFTVSRTGGSTSSSSATVYSGRIKRGPFGIPLSSRVTRWIGEL